MIDFLKRPIGIAHRRRLRIFNGPKRPVFAGFVKVNALFFGDDTLSLPWIGSTHLNPFAQNFDMFFGELLFRRHFNIVVGVSHRLVEKAVFRIAGDDRGTQFTALEQSIAGIDEEVALGFAGFDRMAFVAGLDENGANLALEKGDPGGGVIGCRCRESCCRKGDSEDTEECSLC